MARGSKAKYTSKQRRQARHIEEGYEKRRVGEDEAEARAWATVNKTTGGGRKGGSGRKTAPKSQVRKAGKAPSSARSASARKAAKTPSRSSPRKATKRKSTRKRATGRRSS